MKFLRIYRFIIIFWLILAGLIVWFKVLPLGRVTYSVNYPVKSNFFGGKNFIGNLTPVDRVKNEPKEMASIGGDPVYFSVFTPRTFNEAKVIITYQDNLTSSTPLIEAGVLVDNVVWRYRLAPIENKLLDNNFKDWQRLSGNGILLLQKEKRFSSVEDFLTTLKDKSQDICQNKELKSCLALYNTSSLDSYFSNNIYLEQNKDFKIIDLPLQGANQFYFKSNKKGELKFAFEFSDLNLDKQSDPIAISLYDDNEKICSTEIKDDFKGEESKEVRNFPVEFSCSNIDSKSILYKLEIKMSDDVVLKKITKAPAALNSIGRLHPVSAGNLPLSFWTDSSFIKLATNNPASRQTVRFGGQSFYLDSPYTQVEFKTDKQGLKEVVLNKDDVILETEGTFSFTPDDFFNPEFKKINEHFVLEDDFKYVLADYKSPEKLANGLKRATVTFNTKEAYRERGKYSFMISVPGLSLANQGNLLVKSIKIEFSGRTLWDKIKEIF